MALRIAQVFSISEVALGGKLNRVNDPVAGGSVVAGNTVPGGGTPNSQNLRAGILGFEVELDADIALSLSDITIGTLFAGVYQYVQLDSASPAIVRGNIALLKPTAAVATGIAGDGNYVVTGDPAITQSGATSLNLVAGVFLNTITPGNFGWIQTEGLANVLFANAGFVAIGSNGAVFVFSETTAKANGSAGTSIQLIPTVIGAVRETAAANTVSRIYFKRQAVRLV